MPVDAIDAIDPKVMRLLRRSIESFCGSRSIGKGVTWGNIPKEVRRIPIAQRRALVAEICGKKKPQKPRSPIADNLVRMMKDKLAKINKQIAQLEKQRVETEKAIKEMARPSIKLWTHG